MTIILFILVAIGFGFMGYRLGENTGIQDTFDWMMEDKKRREQEWFQFYKDKNKVIEDLYEKNRILLKEKFSNNVR